MSNTQHTGSYHLAKEPSLYEIQRNNNFEFVVTDLDSLIPAHKGKTQELLRLSVTKASVPHFTQEVIQIKRGNSTIKYAGVPTFDSGELEFNDYVGAETKEILMAWQNLSYNVDTQRVGSLSNSKAQSYKKDCRLIEYTPDYRKVRTWILYGCWISKLSEGPYSAEDGQKHSINATIEYDYAKIEANNSGIIGAEKLKSL